MRLPVCLAALCLAVTACESDDARDPDDPFNAQGRLCLTDPVCTEAKLMTLGELPEDTTGTDTRVAMIGNAIVVAYRTNLVIHTALWQDGAWTALPTVNGGGAPFNYELVAHETDDIYWVMQQGGGTVLVHYDGSSTTALGSPPALAAPTSTDAFLPSDVSVHARYSDDALIVQRTATFNTGTPTAGVATYISRESLRYDVEGDAWTSLVRRDDPSETPASDRAATHLTTGLAALPGVGTITATRAAGAIAFDVLDDESSAYVLQNLVIPETAEALAVTASADGVVSAIWSTSSALRISTSSAVTRARDVPDASWEGQGTSLSPDGSSGVAITYAGDAPVIAYAATSHNPQIHLRWWNAIDWIPFAQIGTDLLGSQGVAPAIAADAKRVCVTWTETASFTNRARVSCFGK